MSAIGVFDSGVGGLTVAREIIRQLPGESIVYFGDTARVPYGIKSPQTVIRFSIENILFLLKQDVKLICVACNTASSLALPAIKNNFRVPIIGVITPGAREAVYASQNKRIGVIGTKGTIKPDL
jgi:glutamate racemase